MIRIYQTMLLGYVIEFFANPDEGDFITACLEAAGICVSMMDHHYGSLELFVRFESRNEDESSFQLSHL